MRARRAVPTLIASLVLVLVAAPGCRRTGGKAPQGKIEGLARTAVDTLPSDTAIVVGLSWKQAMASPIVARAAERFFAAEGEIQDWVKNVKELCKIELSTAVEAIVIALPEEVDPDRALVLIEGAWDEAQIDACAVAFAEKVLAAKMTVTKEAGLTHYRTVVNGERIEMQVAFLGPRTLAFAPGDPQGRRGMLKGLVAKQGVAAENKELMGLMERVDTTRTVWAAIVKPEGAEDAVALLPLPSGGELRGMYGAFTLGASGNGYLALRLDSEKSAKATMKAASRELSDLKSNPVLEPWLSRLQLGVHGKDVVATVEVSKDTIDALGSRLDKMSIEDVERLIGRLSGFLSQGVEE